MKSISLTMGVKHYSHICQAKDFEMNLETANLHMTTLVHSIIENDPNAIIILAEDHGPFLMGKSMKFHLTDDTLKRGASVEGAITEGIITIGPDKGYDIRNSD